ncbi:MAG: hypothetical protein ABW190_00535 [Rhizobacter sp.]
MNIPSPAPKRRGASLRAFGLVLATTLALAACGGGVDAEPEHHDDHDEETIDTAGRLALAENGSVTLRVHDLDTYALDASHTLDFSPSSLYASPGGRYAVALQRTNDQVQFVDGGVWQEDHGDHQHDYEQGSRLLSWRLTGVRPTHYNLEDGVQAAFFMDGDAASTPARTGGVRLVTDASIAAGNSVASLDLPFAIHGLAAPVGNKLLSVSRASDATDASPTHLELYQRSGASYTHTRQLATRCNGMHGGASSGEYTAVGCREGMLLVHHDTATTVTDQIASTALRVATVAAHPALPGQFIGIATEGVAPAPVTTRFYALSGSTAAVTDFVPQGWTTGRVRRAHAYDRSGQRFFVLDDQGTLIVSQWQGGAWQPLARIANAITTMPTAAPFPTFTANEARNEIYLTDPAGQQLVVLDSRTGAQLSTRALGFTPSAAVWLGIAR